MDFDHDLTIVEEFDAIAINLRVPSAEEGNGEKQPAPCLREASSGSTTSPKAGSRPRAAAGHPSMSRMGKFPAKTHAKKVVKELGIKHGIIFLPGATEQYYEYSDMSPEFRQRRHFYYLSGANFAGCFVTYDAGRDQLILWIPYTDPRQVLWYGTTPTIDECKAATAVDDVRYVAGLQKYLISSLQPGCTLYVLDSGQLPALENTKGTVQIDTVKLRPAIEAARVIKTDYEIAMIRLANRVSSGAHRAVLSRLKRLNNERDINAIVRGFCVAQGAPSQAYPVIAAAGINGSTLHYASNNAPLLENQLIVLDAGAEWNCYASDITRTFPYSGKFTPEQAAIYAVVERMQNECIERVRPGVTYFTLHLHACMVAATELLKLGILHNGTAAEILSKGTVAAFFPHGLGHHVGLEVHDVSGRERLLMAMSQSPLPASGAKVPRPRVSPTKREWVTAEGFVTMYKDAMANAAGGIAGVGTQPGNRGARQKLVKGMVVTVEPGIYFCRPYIESYFLNNLTHAKYINRAVLDKYWGVGGVRIEDDILVTADGYENLTCAPKGEEMLKVINSEEP